MRGKRRLRVLLAILPLRGSAAMRKTFDFLPYARELEDMALIRTMGVDAAGPEGVSDDGLQRRAERWGGTPSKGGGHHQRRMPVHAGEGAS